MAVAGNVSGENVPDGTIVPKVDAATGEGSTKTPEGPMATAGEVFSFIRNKRMALNLGLGLFFSACSGCVMPATAWLFSDSFTNFAGDSGSDGFLSNIRTLAFTFMILGVYAFVTMTLQATFMEMFAGEMTAVMKEEWFAALMRQDMAYYDIMDVSGTSTIIGVNGKKFKKGVGRKLGEGLQYTITMVGGLAFGFWASWKLSLLILAIVPFMALSTTFLLKQNQTKTARANESYAKAGSIVYAAVSSIRTILSLNAVEQVIIDFKEATQEAYKGAVGQVFFLGLAHGTVMGSFLLSYLPLILYGSYQLYTGVADTGCDPSGAISSNESCNPSAFGVFGALMGVTFAGAVLPQVSASFECFVGARSACYPALMAIKRKLDEKELPPTNQDKEEIKAPMRRGSTADLPKYVIDSSSPNGLKPNNVDGHIVFNNVGFRYPSRLEVNVFDGFNLDVKAGTTVALVGASGGGKSTVVQLLERFYDPTSGSVTLDGIDLRDLNVKWLRQQIGLVSQEPKLFAASILENIRIGRPEATIEEIHAAAKKSNCHDFIMSFGKGYDTPVGDQGAQLSGGQKQRIAIARTLIMNPKIILLDEATSALDSESEVIVQEALDKLMEEGHDGSEKRTVLVIAHRLSTIRNADMIAVVSGGKIVETGSHAELIAKKGAYFDLVETQKGTKKLPDGESGELSRSSSIADGMMEIETQLEATRDRDDLLTFDDVHFHYPSRPEQKIFRGLDLSVKDGETLAIVGPSGQGKSTIIQLIEKFYLPTKGSIKYKGIDFNDLNVGWLHTQVGLVGQEPHLFDLSIAENIRFGLPNATMDDVVQAAKQANADGFIRSFPDGYDTMVGSSASTQVSGGQKQRIAIARALIRNPKILLLDEATSALDSESERIVQDALDGIMRSHDRTTIVIAHRLSTIRNADRIVVINNGKVREMGTHDELMALGGHYKRLVSLQDLDNDTDRQSYKEATSAAAASSVTTSLITDSHKLSSDRPSEAKAIEKENAKKARGLAKGDEWYLLLGAFGAILAGLVFPGWGFMFAYMIELLYKPVSYCDESMGAPPPIPYETCQQYWDFVSEDMRQLSFKIAYALLGILGCGLVGNTLVHIGFGTATERMNKRVRDKSFSNLVRQEVAYFDLRPVAVITSELSDDAAMIHAFSGEPIRTLFMNLASVFVGLVVSFVYMWPFALLVLGIMPFMVFGAIAEMQMYLGEDETNGGDDDKHSSGRIVIESLTNIRTVASLSLEEARKAEFKTALAHEDPHPFRSNAIKGSTTGLGQFCQMWGMALMYWWGGWLLVTYPNLYDFQGFLISMFSFMFALSGTGAAAQGATDKDKAQAAADRIFTLMERKSLIDPLSPEGKKDV